MIKKAKLVKRANADLLNVLQILNVKTDPEKKWVLLNFELI